MKRDRSDQYAGFRHTAAEEIRLCDEAVRLAMSKSDVIRLALERWFALSPNERTRPQ